MNNDNVIIGIDIDGVLRDLASQITFLMDEDFPYKEWDREFNEWDLCTTLDMSTDELNQWFYNERLFHLIGMAPKTYNKVIEDLNMFTLAAEAKGYKVAIASVQRGRAVTATLHWLAKNGCRVQNYLFFDSMDEKAQGPFTIIVDDNPQMLETWLKKQPIVDSEGNKIPRAIGIKYKYNEHLEFQSLDLEEDRLDKLHDILKIERIMNKE